MVFWIIFTASYGTLRNSRAKRELRGWEERHTQTKPDTSLSKYILILLTNALSRIQSHLRHV